MDTIAGLSDAEVIPKTAQILAALAKDPSLYASVMSFFPTMEELRVLHDDHQTAFNVSQGGAPEQIREHQAKRQLLNLKYSAFNSAVKLAAAENPSLLATFGLSQPKPRKSSSASTLSSTDKLRANHGQNPGEIFLKSAPIKNAKSYDIEFCEGDPSVEENWKHYSVVVQASKMLVKGLTPGKIYWFRVRGIGVNGPGPWSHYVSLMAT
ncbi:MAG TPA: hypothetical protein DCZ75_16550 [Geobacter sp.]|nr:hypothetical protein [Geobacter sp.]